MKVGFISLGCPKNQVDAEHMLARITAAGHELSDSPIGCDVVIVNTCAFIDDAKRESIDSIIEMGQIKEDGDLKKIIVTGCLAERFRDEVLTEMPEVDAIVGLGAEADIVDILDRVEAGERVNVMPPKTDLPMEGDRLLTTPSHWAYLRIAEGCSNGCTYCAIPGIRGGYRSRPIENIVAEARTLAAGGVRELVVVAQDTTYYGKDIYGEYRLAELLRRLAAVDGVALIRVLYCYPERVTDELIDVIAGEEKIAKYIDLPIQHVSAGVLRAMGREGDYQTLLRLADTLRAKIPGVTIRTTVMVGFPGETEDDFCELLDFIRQVRFDKLGVFAYSAEEGTLAAKLGDQVDEDVKTARRERVEEVQALIQAEIQQDKIDREFRAIVEDYDGFTDCYIGRLECDAPDIDFTARFTCPWELNNGDIVRVLVLDVDENGCDLIAEVL